MHHLLWVRCWWWCRWWLLKAPRAQSIFEMKIQIVWSCNLQRNCCWVAPPSPTNATYCQFPTKQSSIQQQSIRQQRKQSQQQNKPQSNKNQSSNNKKTTETITTTKQSSIQQESIKQQQQWQQNNHNNIQSNNNWGKVNISRKDPQSYTQAL